MCIGGAATAPPFKDIVIQDGSSFALKNQLRDAFPGRFTTTDPAEVERGKHRVGFRVVVLPATRNR